MSSSGRIDELRKKFDENPRRYFAPLANEYRKVGDLEQAIFICQEYLPQQPGHMSGHIVYGQALFEAKRLADARVVFETALTLDPENLIALRHLGDIARDGGDLTAARGWYQRVLEADPRNEEIAAILNGMLMAPVPSAPVSMPPELEPVAAEAPEPPAYVPEPEPEGEPEPEEMELERASDEAFEPMGSLDAQPAADLEFAAPTPDSDSDAGADDAPFEEFSFQSGFGGTDSLTGAAGNTGSAPPYAAGNSEAATGSALDAALDPMPVDEPFVSALPGSALDPEVPAGNGPGTFDDFPMEGLEPTHHDEIGTLDGAADDPPAMAPAAMTPAAADDLMDLEAAFEVPGTAAAEDVAPDEMSLSMEPLEETPAAVDDDLEAPVAGAQVFVTETMADLYVAQGHRDEAARIFEQLLVERPGDPHLQGRLEALRRPTPPAGPTVREYLQQLFAGQPADAAAPAGPAAMDGGDSDPFDGVETGLGHPTEPGLPAMDAAPAVTHAGEGSLDGLFGGAQPSAADQAAALVLADAFAGEPSGDVASSGSPSPAPMGGRPAARASGELSLDTVFREEAPRTTPGFSFDQFFTDGDAAPAARDAGEAAPPPADDVEQFNDWLDGLKKS